MLKKFGMVGRKFYFIGLERVFDHVPSKMIWWTLRRKTVMERGVSAIKEINEMVMSMHLTPFCYPFKLVFHQHLNSNVTYPGIPFENSNHT